MAPRYHPDLPAPHGVSLRVCNACLCVARKRGRCIPCCSSREHLKLPFFLKQSAARTGLRVFAKAHSHTLADNGASRRGLQARVGRSACNFEVIFNARAMLVSQPRQLSVIAVRVYSSSTTFLLFCGRSNVSHIPLIVAFCFRVTKNPWLSGVLATLLLPLISRQLE
jgi:hypothetical protein